ncbi:MAG TPA: cupin domain-containing protein [Candidatus Polarisedimenticolaceae bacterium]|nr:cupin domain-containing protein [Candidatus Polarisedimenticolaceae bacterium]
MANQPFDTDEEIDLRAPVEGDGGILTIRAGETCRSWNGIRYEVGMSAKNVGSTQLSMNVATIPPGGVARAHVHVGFELMLYILEGRVRHEYGPGCRRVLENGPGDLIYIEPDVPHEVFNVSDSEPVRAVVARSDASEWSNIVRYDRETERLIPDGERS